MNERESNIELLRLVCMFMIIWIHFTGYSIMDCSEHYASQTGFAYLLPQLIHGLCWCAVNTFILISGYFSIRPKAKSFFNLYLVCAFYAGVLYVINLYATGSHLNRWVLYNTLMPFGLWKTSSNWWFIPNYLILYILSPILNKLIDNISKREFQYFLLLQAIVVFYFGWYRNEAWNGMGLNFINFIFLYFIGRYIALHYQVANSSSFAGGGRILIYMVAGLLIGLIDWIVRMYEPSIKWMWYNGYNNPLSIVAAIGLFMSFKSIHIGHNKVINWFAASALSIYLVHNNFYIVADKLYKFVTHIYDTNSMVIAYAILFGISVALVIGIPIIDKLRLLITNPMCNVMCKIYYRLKARIVK